MKKIILTLLIVVLTACSDKPGDLQIKSLVTSHILKDKGDELFIVENLEKTNGFKQDKKTYIVDVKYDLVFKKGIKEMLGKLKQESKNSPMDALKSGIGVLALQLKYGKLKAGHRMQKEEKITMIKTEQGWQIKSYK